MTTGLEYTMGIFSGILGHAPSAQVETPPRPASSTVSLGVLLPIVLATLIGQQGSGLRLLIERLERAGLHAHVLSWVGTGRNLPITSAAISKVFGADTIARIARQAELSVEYTGIALAKLLPEIVDHLTPGGQLPDSTQFAAGLDALKRKFGA